MSGSHNLQTTSILGLAYLGLPTMILGLFVIFAAVGNQNSLLIFPIALSLVTAAMARVLGSQRTSAKSTWIISASFVASVAIMVSLAGATFDNSWDGQCYHQETVLKIAKDWNPIRTLHDPIYQVMTPWFNAKAHEFIGFVMLSLTGNIEAGKVTNLFVFFASLFLSFELFKRIWGTTRIACVYALLTVLNPIVLVQLPTYYVDGALASTYLCLLSSMGSWFLAGKAENKTAASLGIICSVVLLANLKLSAGVILVVTFACTTVFSVVYYRNRERKEIARMLSVATSAAGAALIVGINPYAMNLWHLAKNPTEALTANTHMVKILETCAPPKFFQTYTNRFSRIVASTLAKTNNSSDVIAVNYVQTVYPTALLATHANLQPIKFENQSVELAPPFVFDGNDLKRFEQCDVRLGGFGPWFGELAIATMILFLFSFLLKEARTEWSNGCKVLSYLSATVALSTIAIEQAWWARYAPMLWTLPAYLLAASVVKRTDSQLASKILRHFSTGLCVLFVCNAVIVAIPNWTANWQSTNTFRQQLALAKSDCQHTQAVIALYVPKFVTDHPPAICERFKEAGVPFKLVNNPPADSDFCYRVTDLPVFCYATKD